MPLPKPERPAPRAGPPPVPATATGVTGAPATPKSPGPEGAQSCQTGQDGEGEEELALARSETHERPPVAGRAAPGAPAGGTEKKVESRRHTPNPLAPESSRSSIWSTVTNEGESSSR